MKNGLQPMGNVFTTVDHAIVRSAIKQLPGLLSCVIEMRFWRNMTVMEVAEELGVSCKTVEQSLIRAARMLREVCLRNPAFSRSNHNLIQALFESQSVA